MPVNSSIGFETKPEHHLLHIRLEIEEKWKLEREFLIHLFSGERSRLIGVMTPAGCWIDMALHIFHPNYLSLFGSFFR
jgi:hypothetical protein